MLALNANILHLITLCVSMTVVERVYVNTIGTQHSTIVLVLKATQEMTAVKSNNNQILINNQLTLISVLLKMKINSIVRMVAMEEANVAKSIMDASVTMDG